MDELDRLLEEILNIDLRQIILSNTRDEAQGTKVKVRPVLMKGSLFFQETRYKGTQVFHENLTAEEMKPKLLQALTETYKQAQISAQRLDAVILVSKKGKVTLKIRRKTQESCSFCDPVKKGRKELSHDRAKQYLLQDGVPVDFLVALGVQASDGKVKKDKYDKFRQINRYLEFIDDVLDNLPVDRTVHIIDFGCGKSYLTFAMYYYLHEQKGLAIEVTGLDLKADVIAHCNELADKLHYDHLLFERGDISTYEGQGNVDMVVSLHACDTATDHALAKAVKWKAGVILAVPCCQHELNKQISCEDMQPILKYGLVKERISALVTDALRANLLEQQGYDTQILEFIDMEHTPKNLLIRAVRRKKNEMRAKSGRSDIDRVTELLHVTPTLEQLLK